MKYIVSIFSFIVLLSCNSTSRSVVSNPNNLPKPIGPYSYATNHKDLIFVSGQMGIDPISNTLKQGIEEQTIQILENLKVILKNKGSDINQFQLVNKIYSSYFINQYPARSTIAVVALPNKASIEIECIAVVKRNKVKR